LAAPLFCSGWCGWRSGNTAAAACVENKIVARFALREAQELRPCFFKVLHRLDPQVLAVWETAKNIEFVFHGTSRLKFHTPFPLGNRRASAASNSNRQIAANTAEKVEIKGIYKRKNT
jgi:hypothetical protein